jgi:hypothetical protein
MNKSILRQYIFICIKNAAKYEYNFSLLQDKILSLFACEKIIVTRNKDGTVKIGFTNSNASRHTAGNKIRSSFSELKGDDIVVTFKRTWKQVCQSVIDENADFHSWQSTKDQC